MKNNYILIGVISILVFAAIIYGFTVVGFPADVRGERFDESRVSNLREIKYQIENYARTKYMLPRTLEELQVTNTYLKIKDPETEKNYEYYVTGSNSYKLCAKFSTSSEEDEDDKQTPQPSYDMYGYPSTSTTYYDFKHGEGNQCFEFTVASLYKPDPYDYYDDYYRNPTPYVYPTPYIYRTPTPYPTWEPVSIKKLNDPNVKSVTTDVAYDQNVSVFPDGFFSDRNEYGLINYHNEPVNLTVEFYKPVKLAAITNTFSYCSDKVCYSWDVMGITDTGKVVWLGQSIQVGNQSDVSVLNVTSIERFTKLNFEIERVGGPDNNVHWKKMKFTYS